MIMILLQLNIDFIKFLIALLKNIIKEQLISKVGSCFESLYERYLARCEQIGGIHVDVFKS